LPEGGIPLLHSYQGKEGMAPAAYLQRYHGPMTEASNPAQVVSSVREAVQSSSSSPSLHKAAESRPKLQPTWHSQPKPYIDKERKFHLHYLGTEPLPHLLHTHSHTCTHTHHTAHTHTHAILHTSHTHATLHTHAIATFPGSPPARRR